MAISDKTDHVLDIQQLSVMKIKGKIALVVEVSELGWKGIPKYVAVAGRETRLFGPAKDRVFNGEVISWLYEQDDRSLSPVCYVEILND